MPTTIPQILAKILRFELKSGKQAEGGGMLWLVQTLIKL